MNMPICYSCISFQKANISTQRHKFAVYWVIFIVKAMKVIDCYNTHNISNEQVVWTCLNYDHIQVMQKFVELR